MKIKLCKDRRPAFALIITVLTVALITIMAVAFLSSSTLDRATSRAGLSKTKADLAARTAVNAAIAQLTDTIAQYPDSATTWETINGNSGTMLYYRDETPEQAISAAKAAKLYVLPLISGGSAQLAANKAAALPTLTDTPAATANAYNLNHQRFSGDSQGWIGAPPLPAPAGTPPPIRAQWINLTDSDAKVTGRYAYWVDDESFKTNVNLLGKTVRGSTSLGAAVPEIPLQGVLSTTLGSSPNLDTIATDIFDFRAKFPAARFFELRALNQVAGQATLAETAKFVSTIYSGALNVSRSGSKRVNLNSVVATSTDASAIRTQLDEIIKTITYHLPNFGERFYRTTAVSSSNYTTALNGLDVNADNPTNRTIYLNKVAANIRDYIDTDSQPTIVNNDTGYTVRIGTAPAHPFETSGGGTSGASEVITIGKERVPFAQEYVLRVREVAFSPRTGAAANYTISIDHYVEFWNMSNRDIPLTDLGPNPFLLIANQPGWDAGGLTDIPPGASRDIKLPLSSAKNSGTNAPLVSFPAGSATVITTDLQPLSINGSATPVQTGPLTPDLTRVFYIPVTPAGLRTYSGQTQKKSNSQLRLNLITRTTTQTDYETEIVLGNDLGALESAWGAGAIGSAISVNIDIPSPPSAPPENRLDDTKYHFRGSSLRGNSSTSPLATTGDPRTNAEQIRFDLNGITASNDKTRYFDSGMDSGHIPANSSLGAPNSFYVNPTLWPDPSDSAQSAGAAPAVIANTTISSIGQLGDIFDPIRTKGDSGNVLLSRSGGRTFRVGQPERYDATTDTNTSRPINPAGLWDGDSTSASREWTAWRLADIFSASGSLQLDGRININGVARDYVDATNPGGAALKAALFGYNFQPTPDSDPGLAGSGFDTDPTNSTDKVNELVLQMQARLRNDATAYNGIFKNSAGPFAERGELSDLPIFNTGKDLNSTVVTGNTNDRGREELFRRLVELTTTRGNVFTVYAVGQSLIAPSGAAAPLVTSTTQTKVTFRIDPVWNGGAPADPFDPSTNNRFKKPDKYAITILYAGD
jgi:hypothetical protein